jgi:hypothetical protein
MTMTYNSSLDHGRIKTDVGHTYGGYSGSIAVNRRFIVKVRGCQLTTFQHIYRYENLLSRAQSVKGMSVKPVCL